jgi:hypothetical protein
MLTKLKVLKLITGLVFINCILISLPVRAEWDEGDPESIKLKMTQYINSRLFDENLPGELTTTVNPELCKSVKFGWQDLVNDDTDNTWKYFSSFEKISVECWERLKQVIPLTPFKIREARTVTQIKYLPFAESGPTILFIFDKNAERKSKDTFTHTEENNKNVKLLSQAQCKAIQWAKYQNTPLSKIGDKAYFFSTTNMKIDADGAPNAYHPNNTLGLDDLKNAGYPNSNWWSSVIVPDPKNPKQGYVQPTGEFKGYFVSQTSLQDKSKAKTDPTKYVDSTKIPYLVFPGKFNQMKGTGKTGDIGFAINTTTGEKTSFVVADVGPPDASLGEVSIHLAEKLGGNNVNPRNGKGAPKGKFLYLVFPYSGDIYKWPLTPEKIDEAATNLLKQIGGEDAIKACVSKL